MNSLKISLGIFCLSAAVIACTSGNSNSSSGPSGVVTGYGSIDGTKGGPCQSAVIADSNQVSTDCASGNRDRCNVSALNFAQKYPNVDCTFEDGHGLVHIHTGDDSGTNTSAPIVTDDICQQRDADMMRILKQAQTAETVHQTHPGDQTADGNLLRQSMSDFDAKYADANCPGQPTKDQFDQEVLRAIHDIESH